VIDPLDAIQIALMDGVEAQIAGVALWVGLAPLGDLSACGAGLLEVAALALLAVGFAQIV
jgi:hypothetical protein